VKLYCRVQSNYHIVILTKSNILFCRETDKEIIIYQTPLNKPLDTESFVMNSFMYYKNKQKHEKLMC